MPLIMRVAGELIKSLRPQFGKAKSYKTRRTSPNATAPEQHGHTGTCRGCDSFIPYAYEYHFADFDEINCKFPAVFKKPKSLIYLVVSRWPEDFPLINNRPHPSRRNPSSTPPGYP